MKDYIYYVENDVDWTQRNITIGVIKHMIEKRMLITIEDFLQRPLLKEKWSAKKYRNAREYIVSVFKNMAKSDPLMIVKIDLLISKIEDKIKCEGNITRKEAHEDALELLNDEKQNGAQYVSLDGQSRIFLGIESFLKDDFSLGSLSESIRLMKRDPANPDCDIRDSSLEKLKWSQLDKGLKNYFLSLEMTVNEVNEFYDFDDVIDILVNKQKGFSWQLFQILKQKHRFSKFMISMLNKLKTNLGEKYLKYFDKGLKTPPTALKSEHNGAQLFLMQMTYFLQYGTWLGNDKIVSYIRSVDDKQELRELDKYMNKALSTFNSFWKHTLPNKSHTSLIINFFATKMIFDKSNDNKPLHKEVRFAKGKKVEILNEKKFFDHFAKKHLELINTTKKHEASYAKNDAGEKVENKEGYKASCGKQDNLNIFRRVALLLKYIDFDKLKKEGTIDIFTNSNKMPSIEDVAIHNGWLDNKGTVISASDLNAGVYDKSHIRTNKYSRNNQLSNLVVEESLPNKKRGARDMTPQEYWVENDNRQGELF